MEDAQQYYGEIVAPVLREFQENAKSRRHVFIACMTLFHTLDYLAARGGKPSQGECRKLRNAYRKEDAAWAIVDQVAHAFKHVQSGGEGTATGRERVSAGLIQIRPN